MANTLTAEDRKLAETLLGYARDYQTQLWNVSFQIEQLLGCAVDTNKDLKNDSIDLILERDEAI